jgi:hypothetical protein
MDAQSTSIHESREFTRRALKVDFRPFFDGASRGRVEPVYEAVRVGHSPSITFDRLLRFGFGDTPTGVQGHVVPVPARTDTPRIMGAA